MNAFDYFFEKTSALEKPFLAGKEEISFRPALQILPVNG